MGLTTADLDMKDRHPRFRAVEELPLEPYLLREQDLPKHDCSWGGEKIQVEVRRAFKPLIEGPVTIVYKKAQEEFASGSVRDSRVGKGRYDLLPVDALRRVALRFEEGAAKYGEHNWRKGQPLSRYMDSAIRHAFSFLNGDKSEDHAAGAAWNILAAMQTEEWIKSGKLPAELGDI